MLQVRRGGLPPGPRGDCALDLAREPLQFIRKVEHEHGRTSAFVAGGRSVVLTSEATLARRVLLEGSQTQEFCKNGTAFFPNSDLTGAGLLTSDGELWRRQRSLSAPAFAPSALRSYIDTIARCCDELISSTWANGGIVDCLADLNGFTLTVISAIVFGESEPSAAEGGIAIESSLEVRSAIADALDAFASRKASLLPLLSDLQLTRAVGRLNSLLLPLIDERKRSLERGRHVHCLLDRLLSARDEDGNSMASSQAKDEVLTLLVAGQETSATLLTWALAFLAINPSSCEQVRAEAQAACKSADGSSASDHPSYDSLKEMNVTEAVLLETLRLRPPAFMVGRCCDVDNVHIGDQHSIRRGQTVLVSPALMHVDAEHWCASHDFRPSRWLPYLESGSSLFSGMGINGAYIPFGAGMRNCIGAGLAMTEAKMALAAVTRHFRIDIPQGGRFPRERAGITLRPESDFKLQITPRD